MTQQTRCRLTLFFIAFTICGATVVPLAHGNVCSQATGAGRWAFTVTGSVILPTGAAVPIMQVGTFREDRAGNLEGNQTRSLGGSVGKETFTGTAAIHSDCTGTATLAVSDESGTLVRTTTLDFVLDEDGNHARSIVTSIVLPNGVTLAPLLTLDYRRIFSLGR
jgi:hypothetical protein